MTCHDFAILQAGGIGIMTNAELASYMAHAIVCQECVVANETIDEQDALTRILSDEDAMNILRESMEQHHSAWELASRG